IKAAIPVENLEENKDRSEDWKDTQTKRRELTSRFVLEFTSERNTIIGGSAELGVNLFEVIKATYSKSYSVNFENEVNIKIIFEVLTPGAQFDNHEHPAWIQLLNQPRKEIAVRAVAYEIMDERIHNEEVDDSVSVGTFGNNIDGSYSDSKTYAAKT